jgi:Cdc6-like AAA superfamily ATPase
MPNPKDWFRRRRRETVLDPERPDPFAELPILQFSRGRGDTVIDERAEPALRIGTPQHTAEAPGARQSAVPPPPPRVTAIHGGRVIKADAFAVRPEIARVVAERSNDDAAVAEDAPFAEKVAAFAVRRRAFFIPRRPPAAATEAPQADATAGQEEKPESVAGTPEPPRIASLSPIAAPSSSWIETRSARPRPPAGEEAETAIPGFTLAAPGVAWVKSKTALQDLGAINAVLRDAFTPTRPKQTAGFFSGRHKQLQRIIAGIEEERAHVVLYGERGSGKTSLANIVAAKAEEAGYHVVKLACSSDLAFDELFRIALRRIPAAFLNEGLGITHRAGIDHFEQLLPTGEIGVTDLIRTLERVHDRHVIIILDEYDRVTSAVTKNKLAELIKNMSDASAPVTILLIGVSENVGELLGHHPSLRRTLVTVPLPLMSHREIEGIIATGERKSGLRFAAEIRARIIDFAQGLPYHAQLLCLFAARSAVRRHSTVVEAQDLRYAVERAAEEAESRVKEAYNLALAYPDGQIFRDVLFAAACAPSDEFGTFALADVTPPDAGPPLAEALARLAEPERGAVLQRLSTSDGPRWQFFNQMMRHYVLVRQAVERGLV